MSSSRYGPGFHIYASPRFIVCPYGVILFLGLTSEFHHLFYPPSPLAMAPLKLVRGIYVPTPTFFKDDELQSLDIPTHQEHILWLAKAGVNGVLIQGSTGEAVSLTSDEKIQVCFAYLLSINDLKPSTRSSDGPIACTVFVIENYRLRKRRERCWIRMAFRTSSSLQGLEHKVFWKPSRSLKTPNRLERTTSSSSPLRISPAL